MSLSLTNSPRLPHELTTSLTTSPPHHVSPSPPPPPLRWTLWFMKNGKARPWHLNLRPIISFNSVEMFWSLYNHIQPASCLIAGSDYAMFKEGVTPMWEDPANLAGGRWLISLTKQQRYLDLDALWLETLLMLVGEALTPYGEQVCGAVVSVRRKGDRIALWTSNADSSDAVITIGRVYKRRLGLPADTLIAYQAHGDSMVKSGQPSADSTRQSSAWSDRERAGDGETAAPAGGDTGW
ncbi:eukaryotic translation initiation factor 4E-1A-like isoform X1 [Lethenteron reissneri]|uniref:eukaryotic translation initiation factor 4E-1A-like isoform X1 n=2 Tax=Lethenteron reissneri TaxID=7753 RepID=UPI002AB7603D|nr:eukaryotic translation initiation factor 4E-1A-like isoform X1 [Lethenteron reissneri]